VIGVVLALYAFVAAGSLVMIARPLSAQRASRRWNGRHQATSARVRFSALVLLLAALAGGAAAALQAHEHWHHVTNDYRDCIRINYHGPDATIGVGNETRALCAAHQECEYLRGSRDVDTKTLETPAQACEDLKLSGQS